MSPELISSRVARMVAVARAEGEGSSDRQHCKDCKHLNSESSGLTLSVWIGRLRVFKS